MINVALSFVLNVEVKLMEVNHVPMHIINNFKNGKIQTKMYHIAQNAKQ